MSTTNTPRPRRLAGHRPSALTGTVRPRKVADSRRAAVRSTDTETDAAQPAGAATMISPALAASPSSEPPTEGMSHARRPGTLTLVLAALSLVLATVVGAAAWDVSRMDAKADARRAAQIVAAESVETILSYDHAAYDKGVTAAKTLMTDDFAKEYDDTVATVRPEVMSTASVVQAEVVASSVVSAEPDRVKALLFVNQTTTGKQVEQPRVDLNRVVVTMERSDEGWLVSDIDAL